MPSIKRIFIAVASFFVMAYLLFYAAVAGVEVDVSKYSGDGEIRPIGAGFIAKGFEIEFESISTLQSFTKRYRLENLPQLDRSHVFYFRLYQNPNEYSLNPLEGVVSLEVVTEDGEELIKVAGTLSDSAWVSTSAPHSQHADLYYFNQTLPQLVTSGIDYPDINNRALIATFSFTPKIGAMHDYNGSLVLGAGGGL